MAPVVALAVTAFLVLFVVLADTSNLGVLDFFYDYPAGDKMAHFLLYALLTLSLNLTLARLSPGNLPRYRLYLYLNLALALLATVEEASQVLFPSRNPDVVDLLAAYAGLLCGALAARRLSRPFQGSRRITPSTRSKSRSKL